MLTGWPFESNVVITINNCTGDAVGGVVP